MQAVPLVLAAAISNIALHGLDWSLLIPLVIGSVPGTIIGGKIAPRVPQSIIRRGIVVVLTMSGVALLDKAGWAPLGAGEDETHPMLIAGVGLAMLVLVPLVWGVLRKQAGLPTFGAPTVAQLENLNYTADPGAARRRTTGLRDDPGPGRSSPRPATADRGSCRPSMIRGTAATWAQLDGVETDVLRPLGEQQHDLGAPRRPPRRSATRASGHFLRALSIARGRSPDTWAPCSCIWAATFSAGGVPDVVAVRA